MRKLKSLKRKLTPRQARILKKSYSTAISMMVLVFSSCIVPGVAQAGVAADVLLDVGMPIVQLMVLGFFGWLVAYILQAFGHGQIAGMVKMVTVLSCVGIVVHTVWGIIGGLAGFFGIKL